MADFSDVLLTVDYDRTMTGPDSQVPARNLEAIRWFMEQGGAFTINTGRSLNLARKLMDTIPMNAPMLLFNGSLAYENGQVLYLHHIDLPLWDTVNDLSEAFPELNVEIQNLDGHFMLNPKDGFEALYQHMNWQYQIAQSGAPMGAFVKFCAYGTVHRPTLSDMYSATQEETERFQTVKNWMEERWGDKIDLCFAAPRLLDAQPKGINKGVAARRLQKELGKKILVCVGDADNDIAMLDSADFAFCPADGVIAAHYANVCSCAEGAVADVIYKKIPEILNIQP